MSGPNWTEIMGVVIAGVASILVPGAVAVFSLIRRLDKIEYHLEKVSKIEEHVERLEQRVANLEARRA